MEKSLSSLTARRTDTYRALWTNRSQALSPVTGYAVHARFAEKNDSVTRAQCWTHARRQYMEAEQSQPGAVAHVLELMRILYAIKTDPRTIAGR